MKVIENYPIDLLEYQAKQEQEIQDLSQQYINEGIIPRKKEADALHVGLSTVFKIDYLVSWNYKHLANINKANRIRIVNLENNYTHDLKIITPIELISYES